MPERLKARLLRLNSASGAFEPADWPDDLQQLHQWLRRASKLVALVAPYRRQRAENGGDPGPFPPGRGPVALRHGPALIAQDVPALIYPVPQRSAAQRAGRPPRASRIDWFIVQLDSKYLREHIFPELTERYFGGRSGLAYRVAVISVGHDHGVLYASDAEFGRQGIAEAEFTVNIFGPPFGTPSSRAVNFLPRPRPSTEAGGAYPPHTISTSPFLRFEPVRYEGPPSEWQVLVKNRGGSLEAVAASVRRRNLAISFGVLLVLAATMGIILITSQRAQRLARLQMDFVAAVSHELRTPLTVISSAADNITDGVVDSRQQLMRYGKVIKGQARQLIHLVEQVLLFAASRDGGYRYHLRTLAVDDVVNAALESTAELLSAAGFTTSQQVEPDLPPVEGDLAALSQCLQNLITNAVKYGGESRWIAVRASLSKTQDGAGEVRIAVADKGTGIAPADLEHIFEPFYRSAQATSAQIHGTGLGLPLAKSIAEAMNGRLTVSSEPGKGSTFVLHLPAAGVAAGPPEVPQAAAVGGKVS